MRRRQLGRRHILAAFLAGGASFAAPFRRTDARTLAGRKVAVIGAGMSGLAAAKALVAGGADVTVLEARARIGGRIFTERSLGVPVEIGAAWIHGLSPGNPAWELAEAVGARQFVTDDDSLALFDAAGRVLPDTAIAAIDGRWERLLERIDGVLEDDDRRSLRDAVAAVDPDSLDEPGMRWALSAYTEFDSGGPIEDLSATLHDEDEAYRGAEAILPDGYDRLLAPLAAGLDIRLSTPVTRVALAGRGVTVETTRGRIEADAAVCSIPLGVLKAGGIAFDPPLPQRHRDAIRSLGFGSVTKIALAFDTPFWDPGVQYFGVIAEPKGRWNYWLNYRTFSARNVLLGFSVGAYAPVAERMSDDAMTADALAVLRQVWGSTVGRPSGVLTTRWSMDPFALGAYSYPRPGNRPADFDGLAEPIAGRLFLCGEHTLFRHRSTVHGAYLSGLRAAERVAGTRG